MILAKKVGLVKCLISADYDAQQSIIQSVRTCFTAKESSVFAEKACKRPGTFLWDHKMNGDFFCCSQWLTTNHT